jgi:hypothetical protein
MEDIYKQKAEKYKYKYLKLKQELEGGLIVDGCTTSPPIYFDLEKIYVLQKDEHLGRLNDIEAAKNKILIKQDHPDNQTHINKFYDISSYIGKLMKYEEYNLALNSLNSLDSLKNKKPGINLEYTTGIKYAYTIHKVARGGNILKRTYNKWWNINELKKKLPNCKIIGKLKNYGYTISENPGESLKDLYLELKYLSSEDFNKLLNDLIIAIEGFIIPLHEAEYILDNIRSDNIHWVGRRKVCFDISKMKEENVYHQHKDIKPLIISISNVFKMRDRKDTEYEYKYTYELLNIRNNILFNNDFWYKTNFLKKLLLSIKFHINKIDSMESQKIEDELKEYIDKFFMIR